MTTFGNDERDLPTGEGHGGEPGDYTYRDAPTTDDVPEEPVHPGRYTYAEHGSEHHHHGEHHHEGHDTDEHATGAGTAGIGAEGVGLGAAGAGLGAGAAAGYGAGSDLGAGRDDTVNEDLAGRDSGLDPAGVGYDSTSGDMSEADPTDAYRGAGTDDTYGERRGEHEGLGEKLREAGDEVAGRAKEGWGDLTDNERLEAEGRAQRLDDDRPGDSTLGR